MRVSPSTTSPRRCAWTEIWWLWGLFGCPELTVMFKKAACNDLTHDTMSCCKRSSQDLYAVVIKSWTWSATVLAAAFRRCYRKYRPHWDSSDRAAFFQSAVVELWWACASRSLSFLFLPDRSATSSASRSDVLCVHKLSSAYLDCDVVVWVTVAFLSAGSIGHYPWALASAMHFLPENFCSLSLCLCQVETLEQKSSKNWLIWEEVTQLYLMT